MEGGNAASLCRVQNCLRLVESLNLSPAVGFKVYRQASQSQRFLLVISVAGDAAFPVYNRVASNSDLALFRGMLLAVTLQTPLLPASPADAPPQPAQAASNTQSSVLQAFLPKFDITRASAEDAAAAEATVAASIKKQADQHVMLVSVKHSGHLATISDTLVSSKSSVASVHCAAAVVLLHAHFVRVSATREEAAQPQERLKRLQDALRQERCSVSFEVVTRCMEHHGQVPAGEYLVATAMTRTLADGTLQVVPWTQMLAFCAQHSLPVNDCWAFWSQPAAAAASLTLSRLSLTAPTTSAALSEMQQLCEKFPEHSVRITGMYPHAEWQGARIEGFVVAQGEATSDTILRSFRTISEDSAQAGNTLQRGDGGCDLEVAMRAAGLMDEATGVNTAITSVGGSRAEALERQALSLRRLADAAPHVHAAFWDMLGGWSLAEEEVGRQVLQAVRSAQVPLSSHIFAQESKPADATSGRAAAPHTRVVSRGALARLSKVDDEGLDAISGGDSTMRSAVTEYIRTLTSNACAPSTRKENPENRVMHALSEPLRLDNALRYKVKMWMFRRTPKTLPEPSRDSPLEAHVGYCMMTMIIRNGLQHLLHGRHAFAEHALLVTRHHCLPKNETVRVVEFAQAWYDWAHMHAPELLEQLRGGHQHLASASYLAHAEKFAAAFTAGREGSGQHACTPCAHRPMRGVLVLVGFEKDAVEAIAGRVGAQVKRAAGLAWSPALPALGPLLALTPTSGNVGIRDSQNFWQQAAADTMVVVRPLPPFKAAEAGGGLSVAQKRLQGLNSSAQGDLLRAVEDYCRRNGVPEERRILRLDTPQWVPNEVLDAACSHQAEYPSHASTAGPESDEQRLHANANGIGSAEPNSRAGGDSDGPAVGQKRPLEDTTGGRAACDAGDSGSAPQAQQSKKARKRQAKALKKGKGDKGSSQQPQQAPDLAKWSGAAAAESLVDQVVQWVGHGVEVVPFDPALVLVFVTIPGVGKTLLCEKLMQSLDRSVFEVVHCHGDAMAGGPSHSRPKHFWPSVAKEAATRRADGRITLVLADKNLIDSPTGNLQSVAATLRATGAVVLPVVFTAATAVESAAGAGALQSSLPGELLAMAMHRVLHRASHTGKLDSSAPDAMHAVNAFANTLRKTPRSELAAQLLETFGQAPCMVPVWNTPPSPQACVQLQPLLSAVVEGEAFRGFPCKPTEASQAWEQRLRDLLLIPRNSSILQDNQVPADEQVSLLQEHVLRHVRTATVASDTCMRDVHVEKQGGRDSAACDGKEGERGGKGPVYIAVAGFDAEALVDMFTSVVHGAISSATGLSRSLLDSMIAGVKRDDLHVTLWHKHGAPAAASVKSSGDTVDAAQSCTPALEAHGRRSPSDAAALDVAESSAAAWHACGLALMGLEGKEVAFTVIGFDLSDRCAAARVDIEGIDVWACMTGVAEGQKGRMHVTLWTAKGVHAREAGDLRGLADRGEGGATHIAADAALRMKGAVKLYF